MPKNKYYSEHEPYFSLLLDILPYILIITHFKTNARLAAEANYFYQVPKCFLTQGVIRRTSVCMSVCSFILWFIRFLSKYITYKLMHNILLEEPIDHINLK